ESGSSSSTDTVWPAASEDLATAEPTRPAPTTRTIMVRILVGLTVTRPPERVHWTTVDRSCTSAPSGGRGSWRAAVLLRGRSGEDHPAGRLAHDELGGVADKVVQR